MSSTCFWTDLVGTQQVCASAPPPPPPPSFTFDHFVFGPVQNADSSQMVRSSNEAFSAWGVPNRASSVGAFEFSGIAYGPGLVFFNGPDGILFCEYNESSYYSCNAIIRGPWGDQFNDHGVPPSLPFGYSNNISFNGSGNTATTSLGESTPPFFRHPTPIAAEGGRWWARNVMAHPALMFTDDGGNNGVWNEALNFPTARRAVALAARAGLIAVVCRADASTANTLVWSTNSGASWNTLALAGGPVENLAIAVSPTQVYRASGTGNLNAAFSNTTALGTATNVGGAFPKRRAWWTGSAWLVERLGSPVQIQRYTDLATTGTSVFSFPAGTTPCGSFLAIGGGRIVVPALLSTPAHHVDFYVSTDDGLTFTLAPDMRLEIGDGANTQYTHGFSIAYRPPA